MLLSGCRETVDTTARYVYQNYTISDYLRRHTQYSTYYDLLFQTPVSPITQTNVGQLLSARGHYTVFPPTNDAIQAYLLKLQADGIIAEPTWDALAQNGKLDSIRSLVVMSSIIDCGDHAEALMTVDFPIAQNAEIVRPNMYDRKLTVSYGDDPGTILVNGSPIHRLNRDIPASNGFIHAVDSVVLSNTNTLGDLITDVVSKRREGIYVSCLLAQTVGLRDSLLKAEDDAYRLLYLSGHDKDFHGHDMPSHRRYGYTFFPESDAFWSQALGRPALEITARDVVDYLDGLGLYPEASRGDDYADEDNLLYQFVTYHLLPVRLAADRIVQHRNEVGFNPTIRTLTVAMAEYYVSMGQRRLMKLYESAESGSVFINRFPVLDSGRRGTYHELSCPSDGGGVRIGAALTGQAGNLSNAMVYPLDELLVYDQRLQEKLGSERIRFDAAAMFPELTNNDVRLGTARYTYFPPDRDYKYLDDAWVGEGSMLGYNTGGTYSEKGFITYYGDEMASQGFTDVIFRLPPVPRKGLYEIRYGITAADSNRGIYQFYWGSSPDRLRPMGIPLDLRMGGLYFDTPNGTYPSNMGWQEDTDDEDYNSEIDKFLRNHGFMKGANIYSTGETTTGRSVQSQVRRIIVREYMKPDETYYIRFKSCLDYLDRYLVLDYMEYCPKEVYDNPETPEDIW